MKALKNITLTALLTLLASTSSFAATTAGRVDNSGFLVWAFLGFCALIVVAQLVPAVLVMLGIVKAVASPKEHAEQKSH
ncbi:MAG: hypothetical protein C0620_08045 [Desulfuromonas sp.]|mgnify:CR=1 FL=1|nr:MAG: hypothetical protein C0620_08045 [Desulfuromonas sp.]